MVEAIGLLQYAVQGFYIFHSRHGHQGQSSARDTSLLYATRRLCSIPSSKTRTRKQGSCETIHQVGLGQSDPTDCRQRNNNEQHIAVLERQECIARAHRLARAPSGRKSATYSDGLSGPNSRPFVRSGVSQQNGRRQRWIRLQPPKNVNMLVEGKARCCSTFPKVFSVTTCRTSRDQLHRSALAKQLPRNKVTDFVRRGLLAPAVKLPHM